MYTCPKCSEPLAPQAKSCPKCAQGEEGVAQTRDTRLVAGVAAFLAGICLVAVLLLFRNPLEGNRESNQVSQNLGWLWNTAQELEQLPPPAIEDQLNVKGGPWSWIVGNYLMFSNGWAAYRVHTAHPTNQLDDIALLRLSNGDFYLSSRHFCCGITNLMLPVSGEGPRPADPKDFLLRYASWQEWNLVSLDGRVRCAVFCDPSQFNKPKKSLWVWIGTVEGGKENTLFEHRYTVIGGYVAWSVHWDTPDELSVELHDFGGPSPATFFGTGVAVPTHHITTLTFCRDLQSGKFNEKMDVSEARQAFNPPAAGN